MSPEPMTADEYEQRALDQITTSDSLSQFGDPMGKLAHATLAQVYATLAVNARLKEMPQ